MKINRQLNLVITLDDGFIHCTPISREVFERYFKIIGRAFKEMMEQFGATAGPRLAYLTLKSVAEASNDWDDVRSGLINEMVRLSNVLQKTSDAGWKMVPLDSLLTRGEIDADSISEILGELTFFTCVSKMNKPDAALAILGAACNIWGSQISSSDCTGFMNSLATLTVLENTGGTATTSSASA